MLLINSANIVNFLSNSCAVKESVLAFARSLKVFLAENFLGRRTLSMAKPAPTPIKERSVREFYLQPELVEELGAQEPRLASVIKDTQDSNKMALFMALKTVENKAKNGAYYTGYQPGLVQRVVDSAISSASSFSYIDVEKFVNKMEGRPDHLPALRGELDSQISRLSFEIESAPDSNKMSLFMALRTIEDKIKNGFDYPGYTLGAIEEVVDCAVGSVGIDVEQFINEMESYPEQGSDSEPSAPSTSDTAEDSFSPANVVLHSLKAEKQSELLSSVPQGELDSQEDIATALRRALSDFQSKKKERAKAQSELEATLLSADAGLDTSNNELSLMLTESHQLPCSNQSLNSKSWFDDGESDGFTTFDPESLLETGAFNSRVNLRLTESDQSPHSNQSLNSKSWFDDGESDGFTTFDPESLLETGTFNSRVNLRLTENNQPPSLSPAPAAQSDLLSDIRKGVKLKTVGRKEGGEQSPSVTFKRAIRGAAKDIRTKESDLERESKKELGKEIDRVRTDTAHHKLQHFPPSKYASAPQEL